MITTLDEIKANLGITNTLQDDRITAILADGFEDALLKRLNTRFLNPYIYRISTTMVFSTSKITDANATFITNNFIAGTYYVDGSYLNDGYKVVANVTETELSIANLLAEDNTNEVRIHLVKFPEGLKDLVAEIIGGVINSSKGLQSEAIGSHSKSFFAGLSPEAKSKMASFRKVYL